MVNEIQGPLRVNGTVVSTEAQRAMVLLNFGRANKLREGDWDALERAGFWKKRYGDRRETRQGWETSSEVLRVLRERSEELPGSGKVSPAASRNALGG